jgi:hypothetical protein
MTASNSLNISLPVTWSPDVDENMEDQLKVLEAQALALRWERFMHQFFQAWTPDIDAVSFRHYSVGGGLDLDLDIEMPDRMYPVGPDGRIEGMAPSTSKPPSVMEIQRQMLAGSGDTWALRRNFYENEVVQPFRKEICGAIAGQSFPVQWVRDVLDCRASSPRLTKKEWQERSQSKIDALVGHYRLDASTQTPLEQDQPRRQPRL